MKRERVAKTWLFRGLSDIFFAFDSDDPAFEDNARFNEIMGLEKFLKAVLLHQRHAEYESLLPEKARHKINSLAIAYGHSFTHMLAELVNLGLRDIEQIKRSDYDGSKGQALIEAVEKGYMETRYPVPTPVSDKFQTDGAEFTYDPLSSSGLTKFIYAVCNACFLELSKTLDLSDMLRQFQAKFEHRKSFARFNNAFWEARCKP